ncbi:MAG: sigma-70 family RNA polymerase sigma factor [Planctomycetes bacterium]|nr:sigma-70 family RNA polymerase sigma factor [Planctomycetota bacterium]
MAEDRPVPAKGEPDSWVRQGTLALRALERGEAGSAEALFLLVYDELRRLAGAYLDRERSGHTLQATALVHEAWLRLVDVDPVEWKGRAHFLGVAARAMRQILVEHARGRQRLKRGGGWRRVELETGIASGAEGGPDLVALDAALGKLAALSERQARIVEMRFFGGLPVESVAFLLGTSKRTVEREWRFARAWLAEALAPEKE